MLFFDLGKVLFLLPPPLPPYPCAMSEQVSWVDLERLLRDKADVDAVAELEANCTSAVVLERVEKGLARAVGMEEVWFSYCYSRSFLSLMWVIILVLSSRRWSRCRRGAHRS